MNDETEKEVLTKQDLILELTQKLSCTHREAYSHVNGFIETFNELLIGGSHIKMSYLGDFILQDKTARPGRNPKTGTDYDISARRVVKFHAAAKLKKIVKDL